MGVCRALILQMTELLYLGDTFLFECSARVVESRQTGEGDYVVVCDRTICYPQGGGQPSDTGTIVCNETVFSVSRAIKTLDGVVEHHGVFASGSAFVPGQEARMGINVDRRLLHARYHLAGHVIKFAIHLLGLFEEGGWVGGKVSHDPSAALVEYSVPPDRFDKEKIAGIVQEIESKANALISEDRINSVVMVRPADVPEHSKHLLSEAMLRMPQVRLTKVAGIDTLWNPCGGTHPYNTGAVGRLNFTKHSFKKGLLRICYLLDAPANAFVLHQ